MSFLHGLLSARSHLAFLLGLAGALAVIRAASHVASAASADAAQLLEQSEELARDLPLHLPGPLSPAERALAQTAWSYLVRNTDPRTGLTASVEGYPSTTMWDVGSQLMAVLAAEDLGLAPRAEATRRLSRTLESLATLPLCDGKLPNKAYDTRSLAMTDYANAPAPVGIGWSALDVARVLVPLQLVLRRHPELTPLVESVVARWHLEELSDGEALRGTTRGSDGVLRTYQEGRLGYEQYAARALVPWGVTASAALAWRTHLAVTGVSGGPVPYDRRLPRDHGGAHNGVVSEPWVLEGLEHGFDAVSVTLARAVLAAQARRAEQSGRLTAVSEEHLDREPWFSYSAVLNGPDSWTAFLPDGRSAPRELTFSTKAAVAWAALFDGVYPDRLRDAAFDLATRGRGVWAGRYDADGTPNHSLSLNTNAVVLEALAVRAHGPFSRRAGFAPGAEARR